MASNTGSQKYQDFMALCLFDQEMFLFTEYVINKKGVRTIARELNSTSTLSFRRLLKKFKISIRTKGYHEDLTGRTFGSITVIRQNGCKLNNQIMWVCRCDCGKEYLLCSSQIIRETVKHCQKCYWRTCRGRDHHQWAGFDMINANLLYTIRANAKTRNIEYAIDNQYLADMFYKQNGKCALSGIAIDFEYWDNKDVRQRATASLDRIDSKKGYIKGNIQWVHKDVNFMKQEYEQDYFIEMCYLIGQKYIEKNSPPMTYEGYLTFVKENEV